MATDPIVQALLGQRGRRDSGRRAAAQRLQMVQPPVAPITNAGAGIAYALTQGLNAYTGARMEREEDERDQRDFDGRIERARTMQAEQRAADEAAAADLLRRFGVTPPAAAPAQPAPPAQPMPRADATPASGPAVIPDDLRSAFEAASRETGIPVDVLAAKVRQESNFNPNARGRAGEIGLAQIMPSTARQPGFGVPPADPAVLASDPAANIMFGARYLRARAPEGTDWTNPAQRAIAFGRYNGGGDPNYAQNVERWMPGSAGAPPVVPTSGQPGAPAAAPPGPDWRGLALAGALSSNPALQRVASVAGQMANREEPRPVPLAPGGALVDPRTGRVIIERPPAEAAPRSPERFNQDREIASAGRSSVSVDTRLEGAEAQGLGRSLAEEAERVRLAAETGAAVIDNVRQVRAIGAETSRLAPAREVLGGWMDALGIRAPLVTQAADLQSFNAAAANIILGRQLEQRGVQTEGDAQRMRDTFAQIRNTMQANDFIMRAAEAQALRAMERAEFYRDWRSQVGADGRPRNTFGGAAEAWNAFIRQTPMVARAGDQVVFLHEWLPAAEQRLGSRDQAMELWRQQASQRR